MQQKSHYYNVKGTASAVTICSSFPLVRVGYWVDLEFRLNYVVYPYLFVYLAGWTGKCKREWGQDPERQFITLYKLAWLFNLAGCQVKLA